MSNKNKHNYQLWFEKAIEDEKSIKAILKENASVSVACFLSQQMTEKLLKAILILHGNNFPKTHDLLELESLILEIEPDIKKFSQSLSLLNRYYINTRYPDDMPNDFSFKEARESFEIAKKIKEFVIQIKYAFFV